MKELKPDKKVIVAMSGGVDSSVAAALLKQQGYEVIGIFMKFWSPPEKDGLTGISNRCCSPEAEIRARKTAKILKIPFYVVDFKKEFKKKVVDYFLETNKQGLTPNPCIVCNKEIKFGLLLEKALKLGVDCVATGHYARQRREILNSKFQIPNKSQNSKLQIFKLIKAKDKDKDQSYFLWQLNQKQLKKTLFPVGDYTRKEVEGLARKRKLPVLNVKKSVEICFIQKTINDFLKRYLKEKPGEILDSKGNVLGRHKGLWFYTIGQRKGIKLFGGPTFAVLRRGRPYYVLDKNIKKNFLIVTTNKKDLYKKELIVKNVNWISGIRPKLPIKIKAKIRYRHQLAVADLFYNSRLKIYNLKFNRPQRAITPGQSAVFYQKTEVLGGGIIC